MLKNKDPAFLFYSSDFLTGVSDLTMEERGKYITLLCLQHQKGHLSSKTIKTTVGSVSQDIIDKFQQDSKGCYYNVRLENEVKKRMEYAKSRSQNGKRGGRPPKTYENHMLSVCQAYEKHTENENITENISNTEINKDIFSFSDTTTTTASGDEYENIELDIMRYFAIRGFTSNAVDFIAYNEARGWRGYGGEDVRADFARYADRWENEELRKKSLKK